MKIAPIICNSINKNINRDNSFRKIQTSSDTLSFKGKHIYLEGSARDINNNVFPDYLYLNLDEVYKSFEKEKNTPYHRWERFPYILANLIAKRCNYLELTQCAEGSGFGSSPEYSYGYPRKEFLSISEYAKNENNISMELEWTREFKELEKFFKGDHIIPYGAERNMDKIKKGLPEILKKQGWIK